MTGHSSNSMPDHDAETNTESEMEALVDVDTAQDKNDDLGSISPSDAPDVNLQQRSVNEEITAMPAIASVKADDVIIFLQQGVYRCKKQVFVDAVLKTCYHKGIYFKGLEVVRL